MYQRFFRPLPLVMATACVLLAGVRAHLSAQAVKPTPDAAFPNLRDWQFPLMAVQRSTNVPHAATLLGESDHEYAQVFDFYAKKIGGSQYDLKQLTTLQPPNKGLITDVSAGPNAPSSCIIDSQTMQATFSLRTKHEYVSVFIVKTRQSGHTLISMTGTTF